MKAIFKNGLTTQLVLIVFMAFSGLSSAQGDKSESNRTKVMAVMKMHVTANGKLTVFELNTSQAAKDLYAQLPISVNVENYSDNEKIFYPPKKLNTNNTPKANAKAGTLAYYAPWGDVVMFYSDFGSAPGLYELGHVVSGSEHINEMAGNLRIEKGR